MIPSFVEQVPNDPALGDEAARLYLQQRLIAARTLTEGERLAAAYRLFQLYRECRAKRPALGPSLDARYAQRSASARAAVVGVSPRNLERYAFVEKHGPEVLAAGLPISTGVIEGACRYLVRDRMDITGARWTVCRRRRGGGVALPSATRERRLRRVRELSRGP